MHSRCPLKSDVVRPFDTCKRPSYFARCVGGPVWRRPRCNVLSFTPKCVDAERYAVLYT